MRLFRPGFPARWLYPEAIFRIRTNEKVLCLTFDDGPDPGSTPVLLDIIDRHNVKCIFFCNGIAAEKYSGLVELLTSKGHKTGNHGFLHYDGLRVPAQKYVEDVFRADRVLRSGLFRPPFGHLKPAQYRKLKKHFTIVFWDLMPYDFDLNFGSDHSLQILKNKIRPGSIIVLHDKPGSLANEILDEFLTFAISQGYRFELIV